MHIYISVYIYAYIFLYIYIYILGDKRTKKEKTDKNQYQNLYL